MGFSLLYSSQRNALQRLVLTAHQPHCVPLLHAEHLLQVTVYERADRILDNVYESYPIVLNRRATKAMNRVNPAMFQMIKARGMVVDGTKIFQGTISLTSVRPPPPPPPPPP